MLLNHLSALLPQLDDDCELLIIDNCSFTPVADTLKELLNKFQGIKIRLIRNRVNIGGNANIIKCFELCETEWLWVLSDAYPLLPDSVRTILKTIEVNKDVVFISFRHKTYNKRVNNITTHGLDEFVSSIDSFGFVLMLSVGIYNAKQVSPYIKYAYHYSYTMAPHIVMVLKKLCGGGICLFRTEAIVDVKVNCGVNTWSTIFLPNLLALRELGLPERATNVLAASVRREMDLCVINYMRQSVQHAIMQRSEYQALKYKHALFLFRYNYKNHSFVRKLWVNVLLTMANSPRLTSLIYRIVKGRKITDIAIPSMDGSI